MTNDLRAELTRDSGEERQHKRVKRVKTSFDEEKGRLHGFQLGSWRKTIEKDSIQGLVKEAEALFTAKDTLPQTQTPWIGYGDVPTCALEAFAQEVFNFHRPERMNKDAGAEFFIQKISHKVNKKSSEMKEVTTPERAHFEMNNGSHPDLVSLTYLKVKGPVAPLVVFDSKISDQGRVSGSYEYSMFGMQSLSGPVHSYVSFPAVEKHDAIPGELLHGFPSDLVGDRKRSEVLRLVVNIWCGGKPERALRLQTELVERLNKASGGSSDVYTSPLTRPPLFTPSNKTSDVSVRENLTPVPRRGGRGEVALLKDHTDGMTEKLPIG